ncbi:MAG: hypothetical protein MJ001_09095, partial [Paludibacteraceae bacterium]|nr:hypothetical protein [Paludibacteraceae bacterium]
MNTKPNEFAKSEKINKKADLQHILGDTIRKRGSHCLCGPLGKNGGDLLFHDAAQYHRREWA